MHKCNACESIEQGIDENESDNDDSWQLQCHACGEKDEITFYDEDYGLDR